MSLQERLNLLVRTDIRLLETCDLRLNGLFFPKYILVLFIGYKTDLMSDPAKSEIRIVLTQEQTVLDVYKRQVYNVQYETTVVVV